MAMVGKETKSEPQKRRVTFFMDLSLRAKRIIQFLLFFLIIFFPQSTVIDSIYYLERENIIRITDKSKPQRKEVKEKLASVFS